MRDERLIMGMPAIIEIADENASIEDTDAAYASLMHADGVFSTYKSGSEISRMNRREIREGEQSDEMRVVLALAEETKRETGGYFDIVKSDGTIDPSGIVKGWAIWNAARLLEARGFANFYINVGSDVEVRGKNENNEPWTVGIRNPFNTQEIVKIVKLSDRGIATSGTYERGGHIWNPHAPEAAIAGVVSLSVIGPNVYEADRFATAAFAMGREGIGFIEQLPGFEGYLIDDTKRATMTHGFTAYL